MPAHVHIRLSCQIRHFVYNIARRFTKVWDKKWLYKVPTLYPKLCLVRMCYTVLCMRILQNIISLRLAEQFFKNVKRNLYKSNNPLFRKNDPYALQNLVYFYTKTPMQGHYKSWRKRKAFLENKRFQKTLVKWKH